MEISFRTRKLQKTCNGDKRYPYEPDYAVAPGRTLQETASSLGIDQRESASRRAIGETRQPDHQGNCPPDARHGHPAGTRDGSARAVVE